MSIFDDLQKTVQANISDFKNVGLPALEAQAESSAISTLTGMKDSATKTAQAGVVDILNRPTDPSSFFSQLVKNTVQSPALQVYGPYLLGGLVLAGVVAVYAFGGKKA